MTLFNRKPPAGGRNAADYHRNRALTAGGGDDHDHDPISNGSISSSGGGFGSDGSRRTPTRRWRPGLRAPLAGLLTLGAAAGIIIATGLAPPLPTDAQGDDSADHYVTAGDKTPCGPGAADPTANPVQIINSGHFAIFDAYWDDHADHLTSGRTLNNNLCPPAVSVSSVTNEDEEVTNTYTRTASNIDIRETLFHVPTSNKVTLPSVLPPPTRAAGDAGAPYSTTFSADRYGFLGSVDDELWIVSKDDEEHLNPGFSTALLPNVNTFLKSGEKVEFELEAVRVPGKTVADRGIVYAFGDADANNATSKEVQWQSDATGNLIEVGVGDSGTPRYHHLNWAFTEPGIYHLQVHIRAKPTDTYCPGCDVGVTSEVRLYKFQVGPLADLGVTVSADNAKPTAGSNVVITYTASNSGPDAAGAVKVSAPMPDDLTYVSAATTTGSYASSTGEWTVGSLASGASATLAITATVGSATTGDTLTPTAYIRDTGDNPDLDALLGNNHATAELRPGAPANTNPQFRAVRSIAENVDAGAPVGAPVAAIDPDGDGLAYTLSGRHANRFTVDNQGQIAVSDCGVMDYETRAVYPLTLSVRDSKDKAGADDRATDASVGVIVQVADTRDEPANADAAAVTIQTDRIVLTVGEPVTLTAVTSRLPSCSPTLDYYWQESDDNWETALPFAKFRSHRTASFSSLDAPGTKQYQVGVTNARDSDGRPIANFPTLLASQRLEITWVAASQ